MTKALEIARKEKLIGHSLDASVTLGVSSDTESILNPCKDDLRSLFIVSSVNIIPAEKLEDGYSSEEIDALKIHVAPSSDQKCERCWVHDPTVGNNADHPTICDRCLDALRQMKMV